MCVCGCTGHRPQNLPWGFNEKDPQCVQVKGLLKDILWDLVHHKGITHFITGMALGFDTWIAEAVLDIMDVLPDISVEPAIPCLTQSARWPSEDRKRYFGLLDRMGVDISKPGTTKYPIPPEYFAGCMDKRNQYIAANSDVLVALWNGKPSGTGNTIKMAKDTGCAIICVDPVQLQITKDNSLWKNI